MSFKTKAIATALILASSTSIAFAKNYKGEYKDVPCPPPVMLKDGLYLGLQAGYDAYRVRESSAVSVTTTSGLSTITSNPSVAATGWVGGIFLGYGQYLTDLFYLGGEIYGNYSGAEENHTITATNATGVASYNAKIEARGSAGIGLLPGIRLNDTSLGYVRLGWNWVNFKANQSLTATPAGGTAASTSTSKSNTSNSFGFGLGIETLVWDNWSVRAEYDHTYLNDFSTGGTSFDPSDNQFTVGVLYHFA